MSRLEEIKENYAKSKQYHNWSDLSVDEMIDFGWIKLKSK